MKDLPFDLIELVACPGQSSFPTVPLRETAFRDNAWLPEEIDRLRARFVADWDLPAIGNELGRTLAAVRTKVDDLGLRRHSSRPWTEMDDTHLARHYGTEATSAIASALGRTPAAVYARAGLLGLTEGNAPAYTAWEIAQIRAGYAQGVPVAQLGVLIGRPACGIATVASRLGIRHANCPTDWSSREQQRALELADTSLRYTAIADILEREGFPRREARTVGQTLRRLGYGRGWGRPWLEEEKSLLRRAYECGESLTPLQDRLGRGRAAIAHQAKELGLQGSHARPNGFRTERAWTEEEIATLRRDYGRMPTPELARTLDRKKGGVFNKAFMLGLKHGYHRPFTDDERRAIALARDHGLSLTDLSTALERDPAVVSKQAIRLGLPFSRRDIKAPKSRLADRPSWTLPRILTLGFNPGDEKPAVRANTPANPTDDTTPVRIILGNDGLPLQLPCPAWLLPAMETAGLLRVIARSGNVTFLKPASRDQTPEKPPEGTHQHTR